MGHVTLSLLSIVCKSDGAYGLLVCLPFRLLSQTQTSRSIETYNHIFVIYVGVIGFVFHVKERV